MSIIEKLGITPGPWKDSKQTINDIHQIRSSNGLVAMVEMHTGKAVHLNARLIASAPDMLEALTIICLAVEDFVSSDFGTVKLIEKATGKSWEEIKELIK